MIKEKDSRKKAQKGQKNDQKATFLVIQIESTVSASIVGNIFKLSP